MKAPTINFKNRGKFQTDFSDQQQKRWKSVQWGSRIFIFIGILLLLALGLMMTLDRSPKIPFKEDYKAVITANKPYLQENKISKEYKRFPELYF